MDLPISDILVYLNLAWLFILLVLFVVVIFLYQKIQNNYRDEEKLLAGDKKLKHDLAKKIEDLAQDRVDEIFTKVSEDLDTDIKRRFEELGNLISKKGEEISDFVGKQQEEQLKESQFFVANMLSKIEKETEDYRKNKLTKVDEEIRQIVLSAAREVIGRAISLSEHEDLVTKALEKAKKEQIFT